MIYSAIIDHIDSSTKTLQYRGGVKKFLSKQTLLGIFSFVFVVVLLSVYIVPRTFATANFTVTNMSFNPATGILSFDYTGDSLVSATRINIQNSQGTYWIDYDSAPLDNTSCTSSHCYTLLFPSGDDTGVTSVYIWVSNLSKRSQDLAYPLPLPTVTTGSTGTFLQGGWQAVTEPLTYTSANDPTFTATASGDLTSKYSAGMRFKLTQTSVKYFLLNKVDHSGGTTTFTFYGGTHLMI